jgi:hypothetical protein
MEIKNGIGGDVVTIRRHEWMRMKFDDDGTIQSIGTRSSMKAMTMSTC